MPMKDWGDESTKTALGMKLECAVLCSFVLTGLAALLVPEPVGAHPGGLAADGCHNDRQNGGRHCHRGANAGQQQTQRRDGAVYYPNCDAARRAGVTPILRGQPGYGTHLDRDGDGKACE